MKKFLLAIALVALVLPSGAVAQMRSTLLGVKSVPISPAAAAMLGALDEAWLLLGPQTPEYFASKTRTQLAQIRDDTERKIIQITERFCRDHPSDPMRWEAVLKLTMLRPSFIAGFKPGFDDLPKSTNPIPYYIVDEAAKAAWEKTAAGFEAALRAGTDVPWEVMEYRVFLDLVRQVSAATKEGPAALGPMEKRIEAFATRFPEGSFALRLYSSLYASKLRAGGDAAEELWGRLSVNPNIAVTTRAQAELARIAAERKPLELAFTAVDGRAVDVAKLRGKVVLVDFWATWCGPCIAELPNVKAVYEKYHAQGFEIIGISLENPRYAKTDTPEQRAEKLAAAKEKLETFTAKESMPWPQYFDGEWWQNPIAKRYAVNAIPAMFLLGPDGKVVTTTARGEKLEAEVKRLLKL
jgi:thiol-disulfide isomerase/thioredoxin